MTLPQDGSIEAEFADGFILNETQLNDISPYDSNHNILRTILNKWAEPEHGKMVRFSCFYKNLRHDVNWKLLPDNARPIRYKHWEQDSVGAVITETRLMKLEFGYQYNDETGENIEFIKEL